MNDENHSISLGIQELDILMEPEGISRGSTIVMLPFTGLDGLAEKGGPWESDENGFHEV